MPKVDPEFHTVAELTRDQIIDAIRMYLDNYGHEMKSVQFKIKPFVSTSMAKPYEHTLAGATAIVVKQWPKDVSGAPELTQQHEGG